LSVGFKRIKNYILKGISNLVQTKSRICIWLGPHSL